MIRADSHAGSWYSSDPEKLSLQLKTWLRNAANDITARSHLTPDPRAIIVPHAGYSYSGETAAHAYSLLSNSTSTKIRRRRVFVLGPSHHVFIHGCALSICDFYKTPIGNIEIDKTEISKMKESGLFQDMSKSVDEDEHSIEMQLPYLAETILTTDIPIVPVLVGVLDENAQKAFGRFFANYLNDESNLFVISSDFCHWGPRFRYTHLPPGPSAAADNDDDDDSHIHNRIQALDKAGMDAICSLDASKFNAYLNETNNTICGRYPILLLLNAIQALVTDGKVDIDKVELVFNHYAQSNKVKSRSENSVSYASGILTFL